MKALRLSGLQNGMYNHCIDSPKGCKALYLERSVPETFLQFHSFLPFPYQGLNTLGKAATSSREEHEREKNFRFCPGSNPRPIAYQSNTLLTLPHSCSR